MRPRRVVMFFVWWPCWLILCRPEAVNARSSYGRPGEEFIGIRYPLELVWTVESNPAFLPNVDRTTVQTALSPQFESSYEASLYVFAPVRTTLGFPRNRSGSASAGLIVHHLGVSDIEGRGSNNEPLGSFSDSRSVVSVLFGMKLNPFVAVGASLKYVNFSGSSAGATELTPLSKSSFGTDVGISVEPVPSLDLGLSISNAPVRPDVTLANEREKWPIMGHFDAQLSLFKDRALLAGGVDFIQNDLRNGVGWIARPEFGMHWQVATILLLGAGYANGKVVGGVRFEASALNLQYSLEDSDLGLLHYISLGFSFGSTGEERYAALSGRK